MKPKRLKFLMDFTVNIHKHSRKIAPGVFIYSIRPNTFVVEKHLIQK